jgi:hypothetical protein
VSGLGDALHERGLPRGEPPEGEERSRRAVSLEKVEESINARANARGMARPAVAGNRALECADLEMLLDVDREDVRHGRRRRHRVAVRSVTRA